MNNLPATPAEFLAALLAGGTLYGLFTTWLIDGLINLWEARQPGPISGTKRRWISIAVALCVPVLAYGGLILLGQATPSADGLYSAALVGVAAVSGGKIGYAARESLSKPGEQPEYRRAHDASGDPSLPNGGHNLAPLQWFPTTPDQQAAYDQWYASLPTPEQAMRSQSTPAPDHAPDPPAPGMGGPSLRDKLARDMGLEDEETV